MKNLTVEDLNLIPISEIDSRQKASIEAFCCGENSIDSYLKKMHLKKINLILLELFWSLWKIY
ncbi:hypothetical protein APE02nite_09980 [Alkalibacterium pelagium]|nr:hypothetical protein APE02nite_09980 [Alkalibacterium pelagium]